MQFSLPREVEASCPHCPYEATDQFIEALYRAGRGTWEQLEDYCERLKKFREVTEGYTEWVRETLARIGKIPEHHVARLQIEVPAVIYPIDTNGQGEAHLSYAWNASASQRTNI